MAQRKVANPLALFVLAELTAGAVHPYALGRLLQEHGKDRNVPYTRGSLYTVVRLLLKAGFIAEQQTLRDTPRPERTVYEITDAGRAELRDWLRELVATPREEYPHFRAALSLLMVLPPGEAVELLRARLSTLDRSARETSDVLATSAANGVAWVFLLDDEHRLGVVDFERDFVVRLIARLEDPAYRQRWHEVTGETP